MPTNLEWALDKSNEQPDCKDIALRALLEHMVTDGLMRQADGMKPIARA